MILGSVTLRKKVRFTQYSFGSISCIEGKVLPIMDKSEGVFTCIVNNGGLVEIDVRDIKEYELYKKPVDPFELVESLMTSLGSFRARSSPPN